MGVVVDQAHPAAYVVEGEPPQVGPAELHLAADRVDEADEGGGEGGLPGPGGAGDPEVLAGPQDEVVERQRRPVGPPQLGAVHHDAVAVGQGQRERRGR